MSSSSAEDIATGSLHDKERAIRDLKVEANELREQLKDAKQEAEKYKQGLDAKRLLKDQATKVIRAHNLLHSVV